MDLSFYATALDIVLVPGYCESLTVQEREQFLVDVDLWQLERDENSQPSGLAQERECTSCGHAVAAHGMYGCLRFQCTCVRPMK
jgi:hypothetical protein